MSAYFIISLWLGFGMFSHGMCNRAWVQRWGSMKGSADASWPLAMILGPFMILPALMVIARLEDR